MIFLIDYDRSAGQTVAINSFTDSDRELAQNTRLQLELQYRESRLAREVVLLEAPNEEALRRTHRRYFERFEEFMKTSAEVP